MARSWPSFGDGVFSGMMYMDLDELLFLFFYLFFFGDIYILVSTLFSNDAHDMRILCEVDGIRG